MQTPSAAAAIRGTDWVLSIGADNVTSVLVYDGQVDLTNSQGSITATRGSGASAARGGVPQSVEVFNLAERQQMLFSVTPGAAANAIIQFERAANGQTPEPAAYRDGIVLLRAGRLQEAAALLERSAPGFDPQRASAARWIAAFARAGGGAPIRNQARGDGAVDRFADAYLSAYRGDLAKAAAGLEAVQNSPVALAEAVEFAIYLDRFDEARRLLAQLQTMAPDSHQALSAEAFVKAIIDGNPSTAVILYRRAVILDSQNPSLLSDLAMAEHSVGHPAEAEAALRRALTLAPGDTDILANLVVVLLDQYRVAEAGDIVDQLIQSAPGAFTTLAARAQVDASRTDNMAAEASALQALSAQPGAAEASILLAIAAHRAGNDVRAQQELDAAARLDPNNPNIPAIRGTIALDYARADEAIIAALEAERLFRQNLAANLLSANRKSGSILTSAFQNIGLTDWARDVADRSHDPLSASSLFNEAVTPRPNLVTDNALYDTSDSYVLGSEIQAYLLDPLGGFQRFRFNDLVTRPFFDAELSFGGAVVGAESQTGAFAFTGFGTAPVPFGFSLKGNRSRTEPSFPGEAFLSINPGVSVPDREIRLSSIRTTDEYDAVVGMQVTPRLSFVAILKSKEDPERRALNVSQQVVSEDEEFRYRDELEQLDALGPIISPEMMSDNISFETEDMIAKRSETQVGGGISYRLQERSILSLMVSTTQKEREFFGGEIGNFFGTWVRESSSIRTKKSGDLFAVGFRIDDANGIWFAGYEVYSERYRIQEFEGFDFVDFPDHFDDDLIQQIGFDPSIPEIVAEDERKSKGSKSYIQRRQRLGGPFNVEVEVGLSYIDTSESENFLFLPMTEAEAMFIFDLGSVPRCLPAIESGWPVSRTGICMT